MTDLFVSYKSEDRARVAPLVAALEADGVGVWWDAHIGGGTEWRDSIERELNAARCVLVVWSERSTGPGGSFVRDEATRAMRRGAYLPVRIDPVEPPLGFGETQAMSLIGWRGDRTDPHYQALLAAVEAVTAGTPRPIPPAYQPKRGIDRRLVIGGGVAAVAALGAGGWWAFNRQSAPGDSIAVLPFDNLSGDPAQAYFSDGIAQELRDALTRIAGLKVAGRSSSELMRDADGPTAAAKLGVATILSGTVRRGAGLIRINAELVDGITGLARWSQAYDRPIGDALAIQTGIAESVAGALSIALGKAQKALLTAGSTTNPAAQDAFLRGSELARKNQIAPAVEEYAAAIAADPAFGKAYASRAANRAILAGTNFGGNALRDELVRAEADARRAIALAPDLGQSYSALALVLKTRLNLNGARKAYDAAYARSPGDAIVLRTRGDFLAQFGDSEAINLYQRSEALDPLRARNAVNRASMQNYLARFDDAIASAQSFLAEHAGDPQGSAALATALLAKGRAGEALQALAVLTADDPFRLTLEAAAYSATDRTASNRSLAALTEKYGYNAQYQIAQVHAWRREPDLAFAAIGRAWHGLDPGLNGFKTDPLLAPIRSDPRYGEWLRRIGFA
ncbi:TIR domain-containing protein [Sphingomonas guangdongensis]|uniref:TIR domain-containing protein n=1 Tax=Sphingomonas guangdongensis TaxID=1141890 RepID=UPI0015CED698|nr:TIR domain-containing protein [Sphingomonas guangdongensis]